MLSKGRIRSSKSTAATAPAPDSSAAAVTQPPSPKVEDSDSYKSMLNVKRRLDKMLKTIEDELDVVDKYVPRESLFPWTVLNCPRRRVLSD